MVRYKKTRWKISKKIYLFLGFVLTLLLSFVGIFDNKDTIKIEGSIYFTTNRPSINDPNIILCIPAAYSSKDKTIIGHYSENSSKRKGKSDNRFTTIYLNNSYFQQLTLVKNNKSKIIKDSKLRYRRALCKKNNQFYIEHSKYPQTLNNFALDLSNKGYENAWNLDMGSYSYGWYKEDNKIKYLGLSSFWNRNKQTNWIIIKK